jgi:aspartyl-tRNA(Asn)/glutamyl-tRNA(Gln) amidotransferase subunit C
MPVTRKDVDTVANLARLSFTEAEKEEMESSLSELLGYFDTLRDLDTEKVEPLSHILPVENVMREDEVKPSLPRKDALANAPKSDRGHFVIPKVIE